MTTLYRKLFSENPFGSIQDYLEMAEWYHEGHVRFSCHPEDKTKHGSMLFVLNQLEANKQINIEWEDNVASDGEKMLLIKQLSLTVQGHKLLDEIKQKSKIGVIKKRFWNLFWVVLTTILTTLIVLKLKGV